MIDTIIFLFRKISNIGVSSGNSSSLNKKIKILNKSSLLGLVIQNSHIAFNLIIGNYFLVGMNLSASIVFYLVWLFNYWGKYSLSIYIMLVVLPIGLIPFSVMLGDVGSENFLFSLIIMAFYILEEKKSKIITIIFISVLFVTIKVLLNERIGYYMYPELTAWFFYGNVIFSIVSITLISNVYTIENRLHVSELSVLNKSLREQNTFINNLLKELNHRVKNNLQMISSLFNLQANKTENKEVKHELQDARDRIITIAMVHSKLYSSNSIMNVEISGYVVDLCNYLLQAFGKDGNSRIKYDIEEIDLAIEDAVHIGLIINELITNSIKYGLSKNDGIIDISLKKQSKNKILLGIADNGNGFPEGMKINESVSFGYFLIDAIIEQHEGNLSFYNKEGASIEILLEMDTL